MTPSTRALVGTANRPSAQRVVKALVNMGVTLGKFGRGEEAIAVYDALDARFGEDSEPAIREGVVRGLVLRGNLEIDAHGEVDAAELAYRRAISLDSSSEIARGIWRGF